MTAPREFRRGWRILVAASVGIAFGSTVLPVNMLGAVIVPLAKSYGWYRGDIQMGYLLFTFVSAVMYLPVGTAIDRFGPRKVLFIGGPLFGASFAAIAFTGDSLLAFQASWALLGILGAAATPITYTRFVTQWFVERRGTALAVTLMMGGLSTAVLQILSTWLVERWGWQSVFVLGGALPLILTLPLTYFWLHMPKELIGTTQSGGDTGFTLREVMRGRRFWLLAASIAAVTFGIGGIFLNLKPLLADRGFTPESTARIAAVISLTVVASRLATGILIDRYWAPLVALPVFALPALSCLLLADGQVGLAGATAAAILIGVGAGAEGDLMAYLTARYFGLRHYGRIYGALFGLFIAVSGAAPFVFGHVFDVTGSYDPVLMIAAVLFVIAGLLPLAMGRYPVFMEPQR